MPTNPNTQEPGEVVAAAVAAQMAVNAAEVCVHTHPVQARALLRAAAELFEGGGQKAAAEACRKTVEGIKEANPPVRHRPGLAQGQARPEEPELPPPANIAGHRGSRR